MSTSKEKSVDVGLDMSKQLTTLASALIPASIALIELRYPPNAATVPIGVAVYLLYSSIAFLGSILMGVIENGGVVAELRKCTDFDVMYKPSVRVPSMLQWILFLFGLTLMLYSLQIAFS